MRFEKKMRPNRKYSSQAKRNWASRNSYEWSMSRISPRGWTGHPKNFRLWSSDWKMNLPIHRLSMLSEWLLPNCWPCPSPGIPGPSSLFEPQQRRTQTSLCMAPFLANKFYQWRCVPGNSLQWYQAPPCLWETLADPWRYHTLIAMRAPCNWSNSHWQSTRLGSSNWHVLSTSRWSHYWSSPNPSWYSSYR